MSRNKKILIAVGVVVILGAIAATTTTTPTAIRIFLLRLMRLHDS